LHVSPGLQPLAAQAGRCRTAWAFNDALITSLAAHFQRQYQNIALDALWRHQQSTLAPPVHEIDVPAAITIHQAASILQMVLDGVGIATFTLDSARPFRRQGVLQEVLPGWITGRYRVLAALPKRKHLPLRTKAFLVLVLDAHQAGHMDRC
jgi:DNA-binding transcriptional LysR family regulator